MTSTTPTEDSPPSPSLTPPLTLHDIFPPVHKRHILHCAFSSWHPLYRAHTPKSRTIPLSSPFLAYLREDGIILPDDEEQITTLSDSDSSEEDETEADSEADSDAEEGAGGGGRVVQDRRNPTQRFPELHERIKQTIHELGGKVTPKLNWSAPKDAAFMTATNSLECRTAGEVYLLLKSSDFVGHDLEAAFDGCVDSDSEEEEEEEGEASKSNAVETTTTTTTTTTKKTTTPPLTTSTIPYHLTLRKHFSLNPSLEFRTFVSHRRILAITQRDPAYYEFLHPLRATLTAAITRFFADTLRDTFPDADFVFDVYIPLPSEGDDTSSSRSRTRVWLVDINPFAPRTDPLLFSWVEVLRLRSAAAAVAAGGQVEGGQEGVELRLVGRDDPEAYSFRTPQYGASKMPRDVVDVGMEGEEAVWEFARRWRGIVEKAEKRDRVG